MEVDRARVRCFRDPIFWGLDCRICRYAAGTPFFGKYWYGNLVLDHWKESVVSTTVGSVCPLIASVKMVVSLKLGSP